MIIQEYTERSGLNVAVSAGRIWEKVGHTGFRGAGAGPTWASAPLGWGAGPRGTGQSCGE